MRKTTPSLIGKYKNTKHFLRAVYEVTKHGHPAKHLYVIGVTGTDGKTTTSHVLYEILKNSGLKTALITTVGAWMDETFIDTGLHTTTPDAKFLQPLLKKFVESGVKYVVLETTSHGLDQHRVFGCNFSMGILTNVTHEHLDYHKTFNKYREVKTKLFKKVRVAVLNKDDLSFTYFQKKTKGKVVSYALNKPADYRAVNIETKPKYTSFQITEDGVGHLIKTPLKGHYNVANILAAVSATRSLKIDWETITKSIAGLTPISGRLEYVKTKPYSVIVDFAHTPNALENLLTSLREHKSKNSKIITVFGCAGLRDLKKRPMMGEVSARLADVSVFTTEDPRTENLDQIIESIVIGAKVGKAQEVKKEKLNKRLRYKKHIFIREPDRYTAIKLALSIAKRGDLVVVCGKGHERSMAFADGEHKWSDHEAVKRGVKELGRGSLN